MMVDMVPREARPSGLFGKGWIVVFDVPGTSLRTAIKEKEESIHYADVRYADVRFRKRSMS
jgi:hypothetical protein